MHPKNRDFEIAIICALSTEAEAVYALFDHKYNQNARSPGDPNVYTTGNISGYNVVLAHMPGMGNVKAASVAASLRSSFVAIKVALVVGICGGMPFDTKNNEIMLGDIIISRGIVQSDFGRQYPQGFKRRKTIHDTLGPPNHEIQSLLAKLEMTQELEKLKKRTYQHLQALQTKLNPDYHFPGREHDQLFKSSYHHKHYIKADGSKCSDCENLELGPGYGCDVAAELSCEQLGCCGVTRTERLSPQPLIHTGIFASAGTVMKSGGDRDNIAANEGVIAFEMEGAGVWGNLPTIIVKSICDYADSHKSKVWQRYASLTAAACIKALIELSIPSISALLNAQYPDDPAVEVLGYLHVTNPEVDMNRIELSKDHLLRECYDWILKDPTLCNWRDNESCRLLWISGDPGKGKTMLMIALVREFSKDSTADGYGLSFFFCQNTDSQLRKSVSVLRGLIWQLVRDSPQLAGYVQKEYEQSGKCLLEGGQVLYTLFHIFSNMLKDASLKRVYLLVDALDECDDGREELLRLITKEAADPSSKAKWLLSSRNYPDIKEVLQPEGSCSMLSLELNAGHISKAVGMFIDYKINDLTKVKGYSELLKREMKATLAEKADSTFLWVSVACKSFKNVRFQRDALKRLQGLPTTLQSLYHRMMNYITDIDDDEYKTFCLMILRSVFLAFRPLSLDELLTITKLPHASQDNYRELRQIVEDCGSFLTIREDTVYFVHQSAKEYLSTFVLCQMSSMFPESISTLHFNVLSSLLSAMSQTLRRDIYDLQMPGTAIKDVSPTRQNLTLPLQYACSYWVDHLREIQPGPEYEMSLNNDGIVYTFLKEHFLHWLEALSLMRSLSTGVLIMRKLKNCLNLSTTCAHLLAFTRDAIRFILAFREIIEKAPLQAYYSALVFSPRQSLIKELFKKEQPSWIEPPLMIANDWSSCLQTLEGHTDLVQTVAFSSDGQQLASGSHDQTVRLWDATTGAALHILEGHTDDIHSIVFSPDGHQLASGSGDQTIRLWDAISGTAQQTLKGHIDRVRSVAFNPNGKQLASGSHDQTVRLWDIVTCTTLQTLEGHTDWVQSVVFSPNGQQLASGSGDQTIRLWDTIKGTTLQILQGHTDRVESIAFTPNSQQLASGSSDQMIRLWDTMTGTTLRIFKGHIDWVWSIAFNPNGQQLASVSGDRTIRLWDVSTGTMLQTLEGHTDWVWSIAYSPDGQQLVSGSDDQTVRLWDITIGTTLETLGHTDWVQSVAFSPDGLQLASGSGDQMVRLWDAVTGVNLHTLKGHTDWVRSVAFSPDSQQLASGSDDHTVRLWDIKTGSTLQTLKGHKDWVLSVVFSPDCQQLVSISRDQILRLWDSVTGAALQTLEAHTGAIESVISSYASLNWMKEPGVFSLNQAPLEFKEESPSIGYGINSDKEWITWNSSNVLWVPLDYRPTCSAIEKHRIAIGCVLGDVYILNFSSSISPLHKN